MGYLIGVRNHPSITIDMHIEKSDNYFVINNCLIRHVFLIGNAWNSLCVLGCLMTHDLSINFETKPFLTSCERGRYNSQSLLNINKGRGNISRAIYYV